MRACVRACVRMFVCSYFCACVCACLRAVERAIVRVCVCVLVHVRMSLCVIVRVCVSAARACTCCMSDHVLASGQRTSVTNQSIVCHSSNKAVFGYFFLFKSAQAASEVSEADDFRVKYSTSR